eukprot:CAMPEP_0177796194 /NCGR_PEP_ID=MMETSP0491_2-20121128/26651_1 /TAXON_ID=63592 /ORGANISM="Tetraselmis chuii, Strain PLY429" /LENGTH=233 /DNA_ID=CAMNT_0019319105 /DNA_START=165 /DNA_END=866 /DNA_ORIENTATION=-
MTPLREAVLALSSRPFVALAGGVAVAGAAAVLLFPRALPKFDLVLPWRSGTAMARLGSNGKDHRYLGYATCATLPGHPWLSLLAGVNSKSRRDFRRFGKEIEHQLKQCEGFVGHFRCWRPLRNEFVWVTIWESKDALLHDFWTEGAHRKAMAFYKLYGMSGGKKAPFNFKFSCTHNDIEYITHDYGNTIGFWKALRASMPANFKGALLASEPSMRVHPLHTADEGAVQRDAYP